MQVLQRIDLQPLHVFHALDGRLGRLGTVQESGAYPLGSDTGNPDRISGGRADRYRLSPVGPTLPGHHPQWLATWKL
jgi:hypothetical protein